MARAKGDIKLGSISHMVTIIDGGVLVGNYDVDAGAEFRRLQTSDIEDFPELPTNEELTYLTGVDAPIQEQLDSLQQQIDDIFPHNHTAGEITSGLLKSARIAGGTASEGYIPKIISGVPTWAPDATGGGGSTADIQNQINALAYGLGLPLALSPSYDNVGGQGNRTSLITVTMSSGLRLGESGDPQVLVNGSYYDPTMATDGGPSAVNKWIKFSFPVPVLVTEISIDMGAGANGNWMWQGSQDEVNWANLLASPVEFTTPSGTGSSGGSDNASRLNQLIIPISAAYAWKHYRFIGISGTLGGTYLGEFAFEILGLE